MNSKTKNRGPFPVFEKDFKKSSFSCRNPPNCVEVAIKDQGVAMRNSKKPQAILFFTHDEWTAFKKGIKAGEFGR